MMMYSFRKTRRPDVQVYVPRGRRLQVQPSRSPQTNDRTVHPTPDDTTVESQRSVGRGHRYSSSPQQRIRSSPQGPARMAASAIGSILKGQTNSSKLENRSQTEHGVYNDLNVMEDGINDKLDTYDIASSPVTKLKEIAGNKKDIETNQVSLKDTPVRDDLSEMNQTNDEILENDHDMLSDENVSEQESEFLKQSNQIFEDSKTEPHSGLGKSDDKERCIKKMKISENMIFSLDDGSNLCDNAKISQVLHSEANSFQMNSELNTPSEFNSELSHEYYTNDHNGISLEAKTLDSVVFEKDSEDSGALIESQNVGLYPGAIETDTVDELFENKAKFQNENIITEKEHEKQVPSCLATELSSDFKPVSNDNNSFVINDSCTVEEGGIQSTCTSEVLTDETLSVDLRQIVKNNLSDDQHEQLQMQETVQGSDKGSCDIDRHLCDMKASDVDEVDKSQIEDISATSSLQNDNLSIEKAFNEQSCDKRDSLTSHKLSTDVLPESNIKVSGDTASMLETEHAACGEVLDLVDHSVQQEMMEIDTAQMKECSNSCDDANNHIKLDDDAQEDGLLALNEDCKQDTLYRYVELYFKFVQL